MFIIVGESGSSNESVYIPFSRYKTFQKYLESHFLAVCYIWLSVKKALFLFSSFSFDDLASRIGGRFFGLHFLAVFGGTL